MKRTISVGIAMLLLSALMTASSHTVRPHEQMVQGSTQNPPPSTNVDSLQITSRVFKNTRTIHILLPPGYRDPANAKRSYAVFYFTDGITVFKSRSFFIEKTVYDLTRAGKIPPMIIIGVDNGASTDKSTNPEADRANEFLPYPDVGFSPDHSYPPDPPSPQGKLYPEFLIHEVMPLVKQHYRVKTGPRNTGLGGFSYGGVAALYTAIASPGVFGKLLLESTPLWIGPNQEILEVARRAKRWPGSVYIGSGTNETSDEAVRKEGRKDEDTLIGIIQHNSPETAVKSVVGEGGTHEPSAWNRRLPVALQFLFGPGQ